MAVPSRASVDLTCVAAVEQPWRGSSRASSSRSSPRQASVQARTATPSEPLGLTTTPLGSTTTPLGGKMLVEPAASTLVEHPRVSVLGDGGTVRAASRGLEEAQRRSSLPGWAARQTRLLDEADLPHAGLHTAPVLPTAHSAEGPPSPSGARPVQSPLPWAQLSIGPAVDLLAMEHEGSEVEGAPTTTGLVTPVSAAGSVLSAAVMGV
mmetsp:Transcript_89944/g.232263  ORF Transcript_89944/g.232263 Transcript_89944/m.232263 type:complete len:208 (+) Transcript_89944:1-624(+)